MIIAKNIRHLRLRFNMSQDDLSNKLGYKSFTTIQKWESGISTPPLEIFIKMAEIFDVDLDDFARKDLSSHQSYKAYNQESFSVPVYDRIPAGVPLEAIKDIKEHIIISERNKSNSSFFALKISGNSMYPKYEDGDLVLFEHMNVCESGEDCIVRFDGEDATFKKIRRFENSIILQPINTEYDPIQIDTSEDNSRVEILGVARELRRKT